jgi:hypothetical protein
MKKKQKKSKKPIKKKNQKKKPVKKGGNINSDDSKQISILVMMIPFIVITTMIIIMLFRKVKCPIKDTMTMKVEELPRDQIVLIAAKDLKNKSIVTQPGISENEKDVAMSDDLSPDLPVLATAGEAYPGTSVMVEMSENVWDTIPFTTKYVDKRAWVPINDARACAKQCLTHEWCKTMGVSKLGKCYASALDMTNPMPKKEKQDINSLMDEIDDEIDEEDQDQGTPQATNSTNTSLIMKYGTKDRSDDFESRD